VRGNVGARKCRARKCRARKCRARKCRRGSVGAEMSRAEMSVNPTLAYQKRDTCDIFISQCGSLV